MKRYLRPLGLLSGSAARDAVAGGLALPLAGGPLAFTLVEVIERYAMGDIRRSIVPASAYSQKPLARETGEGGTHRLRWEGEGARDLPSTVMGIVNATPDSFSDGGAYFDPASAIGHAAAMIQAGARIVDVGGESTRPGAAAVPVDEEIRRIVPVIAGIRAVAQAAAVTVSVDTRNARTMQAALGAGATMINDVSALAHDPDALAVAARSGARVVLMHMRGNPATMQQAPSYDDVVLDVYDQLEARIAVAQAAGIALERIVVDPGIGFGKTAEHNLALLSQISLFHGLGVPLLIGVSRKGFIARLSAGEPADKRLGGSLAAGLAVVGQGVEMRRVHDVPETIQALRMAARIRVT
jgi:dihydropteroate synthase